MSFKKQRTDKVQSGSSSANPNGMSSEQNLNDGRQLLVRLEQVRSYQQQLDMMLQSLGPAHASDSPGKKGTDDRFLEYALADQSGSRDTHHVSSDRPVSSRSATEQVVNNSSSCRHPPASVRTGPHSWLDVVSEKPPQMVDESTTSAAALNYQSNPPFSKTAELDSLRRQSETLREILQHQGVEIARLGLATTQRLQSQQQPREISSFMMSSLGGLGRNGQSQVTRGETNQSHRYSEEQLEDGEEQELHSSRDELSLRLTALQDKKDQIDDLLEQLDMLRHTTDTSAGNGATSSSSSLRHPTSFTQGSSSLATPQPPPPQERMELQKAEQKLRELTQLRDRLQQLQHLMHFYENASDQLLPSNGRTDDLATGALSSTSTNGKHESEAMSLHRNRTPSRETEEDFPPRPADPTPSRWRPLNSAEMPSSSSVRSSLVDEQEADLRLRTQTGRHNVRQLGRLIQFLQSGQSTSQLPADLVPLLRNIAGSVPLAEIDDPEQKRERKEPLKGSYEANFLRLLQHQQCDTTATRGTATLSSMNGARRRQEEDELEEAGSGDDEDDILLEDAEEEEEEPQSVASQESSLMHQHQHPPFARTTPVNSTPLTFPKGLEARARVHMANNSTASKVNASSAFLERPPPPQTQAFTTTTPQLHYPQPPQPVKLNGDTTSGLSAASVVAPMWNEMLSEQVHTMMQDMVNMQQQLFALWHHCTSQQAQSLTMSTWMQQQQQMQFLNSLVMQQHLDTQPRYHLPYQDSSSQEEVPTNKSRTIQKPVHHNVSVPVPKVPHTTHAQSSSTPHRPIPSGLTLWSSDDSLLRTVNSHTVKQTTQQPSKSSNVVTREQDSVSLLREAVSDMAESFITQNETRPQFLVEIFRHLQRLDSDAMRRRALQQLKQITSDATEKSLYADTLRQLEKRTAKLFPPSKDESETSVPAQSQSSSRYRQGPVGGPACSSSSACLQRSVLRPVGPQEYGDDSQSRRSSFCSTPVATASALGGSSQHFTMERLNETVFHVNQTMEVLRGLEEQRQHLERMHQQQQQLWDEHSYSSLASRASRLEVIVRDVLHSLLPHFQRAAIQEEVLNAAWRRALVSLVCQKVELALFQQCDEQQSLVASNAETTATAMVALQQQLRTQMDTLLVTYDGRRMSDCLDSVVRDLTQLLVHNVAFYQHLLDAWNSREHNLDNDERELPSAHDRIVMENTNAQSRHEDLDSVEVKSEEDENEEVLEDDDDDDEDEEEELGDDENTRGYGGNTILELVPSEAKPLNLIGSDEDEVDVISGCSSEDRPLGDKGEIGASGGGGGGVTSGVGTGALEHIECESLMSAVHRAATIQENPQGLPLSSEENQPPSSQDVTETTEVSIQ